MSSNQGDTPQNSDIPRGTIVSITPPPHEEDITLPTVQSKMVELYENERYSALSGWSSGALQASDGCAAFTPVDDCHYGWATLQEASKAMLSRGWSYWDSKGKWNIDHTLPSADEDGWVYAADFNELEQRLSSTADGINSSPMTSRMMRFVRRRKRLRYQHFNANIICIGSESFTCDHCDWQEVDKIAELLLQKTLHAFARSSPRSFSEARFLPIKNSLIGDTGIYDSKVMRVPYRYELLERRLTKFVEEVPITVDNYEAVPAVASIGETRSRNGSYITPVSSPKVKAAGTGSGNITKKTMSSIRNVLSGTALSSITSLSPLASSSSIGEAVDTLHTIDTVTNVSSKGISESDDNESSRLILLRDVYFTIEERKEIARLIIRKLDTNYEYHCSSKGCGKECIYSPITCNHIDCQIILSKKWAKQHERECPERTIACERRCGVSTKRKSMMKHLKHECMMRELSCPYYDFGCRTIMLGKDLEGHMQEAQSQHLEMSVARVKDHDIALNDLRNQMITMRQTIKSQHEEINSLKNKLAEVIGSEEGRNGNQPDRHNKSNRIEVTSHKNTAAIMSLSDQLVHMQKQMEELTLAVQLKADNERIHQTSSKPL